MSFVNTTNAIALKICEDRNITLSDFDALSFTVFPVVDAMDESGHPLRRNPEYVKFIDPCTGGLHLSTKPDISTVSYYTDVIRELTSFLETTPAEFLDSAMGDLPQENEYRKNCNSFDMAYRDWWNSSYHYLEVNQTYRDWLVRDLQRAKTLVERAEHLSTTTLGNLEWEYYFSDNEEQFVYSQFKEVRAVSLQEAINAVVTHLQTDGQKRAYLQLARSIYYYLSQGIPEREWYKILEANQKSRKRTVAVPTDAMKSDVNKSSIFE